MTVTSSKVDANALAAEFRAAASALGARDAVDEVVVRLTNAYAESHRAYHTLSHVDACLRVLDLVRSDVARPNEIALAIWFHDAFYDVYPFSRNEERSAELAYESCLRMRLGDATAERIRRAVVATKDHRPTGEAETDVLLDVDLSILGGDPEAYAVYERDVRTEYRWLSALSDVVYRRTRARLLEGMLRTRALFSHPTLHARFESPARANLARAIAELREEWSQTTHAHATDDYVVVTRAAAFEAQFPWRDLRSVVHVEPDRYEIAFSTPEGRPFDVVTSRQDAPEVVARLLGLPSARIEPSARDRRDILYVRDRHGTIEGPVRIPAPTSEAAPAYRANAR